MLNIDSFLAILQAFALAEKKLRFPVQPKPFSIFAGNKPAEAFNAKEYLSTIEKLRFMFRLPDWKPPATKNTTFGIWAESLQDAWENSHIGIAFLTSGSTGERQICLHDREDLMQESGFLSTVLGDRKNFVLSVPPFHCYGFMFGICLPAILERETVPVIPLPPVFFSSLQNGDAGIATPLIYEHCSGKTMLEDVTFVSASSPLPAEIHKNCIQRGNRFLDIFGSSETGVLGIRVRHDEPYKLLPYFTRRSESAVCRNGKEIALQDILEWTDDKSFFPKGRLDRIVQVGGVNVSPLFVAKKLKKIEGVKECAVRLMRPNEGHRLKAYIVANIGMDIQTLRRRIDSLIRNFPVEERPGRIDFGPEIPKNAMGKPCDWN